MGFTPQAEVVADRVNAVNLVISLATIAPWQILTQGERVATVKIISCGVAGRRVMATCAAAAQGLRMRSAAITAAVLIQTTVQGDQ